MKNGGLYIPPGVDIPLVEMNGPGGDKIRVNCFDVDEYRARGYKAVGGGEKIKINDTGTPAAESSASSEAGTKSSDAISWLKDEHATLAKIGDAREPWQIAGDEAFVGAVSSGKTIDQATKAAYKAAKAIEGSPLK